MSANPLVAERVDSTTPFAGTLLLEDGEQLVAAVQNGDWVSGGMALFSGAMDTVAAVSDPMGTLFAMGLGWVIDHVSPLNEWLEDLTGDADQVAAFATTWANVATSVQGSADELARVVAADLADMDGLTVVAYRALAADMAEHLDGAGRWASGMSTALQVASTLVQIVHDVVRDAIAQVLGAVASYAVELVATAGLATPLVIEQAATRAAALATRVGRYVTELLSSFRNLQGVVDSLRRLMDDLGRVFDDLVPGRPAGSPEGFTTRTADAVDPPTSSRGGPGADPGTGRFETGVPGATPRTYRLDNGAEYSTSWAPEQIDVSRTAAHVIDERLADDALFAAHGLTPWTREELVDVVRTPVADLTAAQKAVLREIADSLPPPGRGDAVQKVLTNDQAQRALDPATAGDLTSRTLSGSITRVEDSAFLDSVSALHDGLRLDYDDLTFLPHDESVYVVRSLLDRDVAEVSRFSDMGGTGNTDGWHDPYTGNGFLKSDALIPEYRIDQPKASPYEMVPGTEMWEVLGDGTQRLAAVVVKDVGWVRVR